MTMTAREPQHEQPAAQPAPAPAPAPALRPPRRIVIATINRAEGDTGVHTHTRMLVSGLRFGGVSCDVVSAFDGGARWLAVFALRPLLLRHLNATWATLWHRRWHAAALRAALRQEVTRRPPDVILAQCPVSARAALEVRSAVGGTFAVALVCHFNQSEAAEYRDKGELSGQERYQAMLRFEDRVLADVDRVIYVSHWARRNVEEARGVAVRAASVILNGAAEPEHVSPLTRRDLGLRDDDLVLINVGTFEPRKNQLGLLGLFAALRDNHPSAKLVLVGDGPARRQIEQEIAALKLGGSVILLGHRPDVSAILPLADLYLHYASVENCPLVLIESARAGLPFAAVPAGGVPELQAALDCRYELAPHEHRRSIDAIRPLLERADARRAAGERARQKFQQTLTREAMTRAYVEALAATSRPPRRDAADAPPKVTS